MDKDRDAEYHEPDVRVSWIYGLKKDALIAEAMRQGLATEGNVEELRARLVLHYRSNPITAPKLQVNPDITTPVLTEPESLVSGGAIKKTKTRARDVFVDAPRQQGDPPESVGREPKTTKAAELCDQVRKWGIKFDGTGDAMSFRKC